MGRMKAKGTAVKQPCVCERERGGGTERGREGGKGRKGKGEEDRSHPSSEAMGL